MTVTFETDNDIIVYPFEKIISFARNHQYIFLAQSVWWISSIIGLQEGLVVHIDHLNKEHIIEKPDVRLKSPKQFSPLNVHPSRVQGIQNSDSDYITSEHKSISTTETNIHNEVIDNCEAFLQQSKQERKAVGRFTRKDSRVLKRKAEKKKSIKTFGTQTEGIDGSEIRRRKAAGECQCCAWPQDRKGSHKTLDCFHWKRLEKGTAPFPKKKNKD